MDIILGTHKNCLCVYLIIIRIYKQKYNRILVFNSDISMDTLSDIKTLFNTCMFEYLCDT